MLSGGDHHGRNESSGRDMCEGSGNSVDAFVFRAPLPVRLDYINYLPNHLGAENVLMSELAVEREYNLYNPCDRYRIYHVNCNRGMIQQGKTYTSGLGWINKEPYPPATYQRHVGVSPKCRIRNSTTEGPHPTTWHDNL
jgi:hypothetical protein